MKKKIFLKFFSLTTVFLLSFFVFNNVLAASCEGISRISYTNTDDHWALGQANDYFVAQTFLADDFDTITKIDVYLSWRTEKLFGDCVLYIYDTLIDTKPDLSTVLGSASVPCSAISAEYPNFSAIGYTFDEGVSIQQGHLYAFAVRQEPATDGGESWVGSSAYSSPYADGIMWRSQGTIDSGEDAAFIVYGCVAPIPPPPPKMVCATSTFANAYMDIEYITGCTEHFTSSTQPDFVEYTYYHLPILLFVYIGIIFIFMFIVMSLFFKYYKKNNKF